MHNDHEPKTGGASIKPSARPSIHSHRGGCVFKQGEIDNMGTYGLESNKEHKTPVRANTSNDDVGRDEVDCISNHANLSPLSIRQINRRKSFDTPPSTPDENLSTSQYAKSLPTTTILHSYSSEDFERFTRDLNASNEIYQNLRNESRDEREAFNNSGTKSSPKRAEHAINIRKRQTAQQNQKYTERFSPSSRMGMVEERMQYYENERQEAISSKPIYPFIFVLIVIIGTCYGVFPDQIMQFFNRTSHQYNTERFNNDLNAIAKTYKMTDDSVLQLQAGLSTIVQRQDTGSFLFAYKSNSRNFDQDNLDNLIDSVATTASKYLRNDTVRHIVVDGSKLQMRTHSELINKYRGDVTKTGVMLVKELDEVPSSLAMAFHYYCDELNPLVKKSAIIFTLDMTKCSFNPDEQKATHAYVEKCLKKKWSGLPKDNISPLLNRVVSTIIDVATD